MGQFWTEITPVSGSILDGHQHCAKQPQDATSASSELITLFQALSALVLEMREIDDTIYAEEWFHALLHLSVRRLLWKKNASASSDASVVPRIFGSADEPTFEEFAAVVGNDVVELIALIDMAVINLTDTTDLKELLKKAAIDISGAIAVARRLKLLNERKYAIQEEVLRRLQSLS